MIVLQTGKGSIIPCTYIASSSSPSSSSSSGYVIRAYFVSMVIGLIIFTFVDSLFLPVGVD
jgi:hypothetical protein